MQEQPWKAATEQLEGFNASVFEGRWGSVMTALEAVVPLMPLLRATWDAQKFGMPRGSEAEDDAANLAAGSPHRTLSVAKVDAALSNPLFSAYVVAMQHVADAILHLQSESCPCRPLGESDKCLPGCPLRGRRGPELAAGAVQDMLSTLLRVSEGKLPCCAEVAVLKPEDKAVVMHDFAAAKRHIELYITLKLSIWNHLPHVFFGLAHPSSEDARRNFQEPKLPPSQALQLLHGRLPTSNLYCFSVGRMPPRNQRGKC